MTACTRLGSRPDILYGLAKVHKALVNNCPKFTPILSAIGTCSYKLAKFLVPVLSNITDNEYTIKDYFQFGKDVLQQDSNLYMGSLDVEALFTNLPLRETFDITGTKLFENQETVSNLIQSEFRELLEMATYTNLGSYSIIRILSKRIGSQWGRLWVPVLRIFLCHITKKYG